MVELEEEEEAGCYTAKTRRRTCITTL